jgi:CubicO group peptidase (beta-lactamase class C family)
LILNRGKWNGEQIVSEEWVHESTTGKVKITGTDYGVLWWDIPLLVEEKLIGMKAATGNGGQYIFILPELDMVAVFTGGAHNSDEDKLPIAIMRDIVVHTFIAKPVPYAPPVF